MPSLGWFESDVGRVFCADFSKVCGDLMRYVMDADPSLDNYERYDVLVGHDPSGTSVMNMAHWKQLLDTKKFQAYDYGSAKDNSEHYGQPYPPVWNLNNIRVPLRLFAGSSDELADITDVNYLWDSLAPEAKEFLRFYPAGHCTFMWGNNVAPWMNDLFAMLQDK